MTAATPPTSTDQAAELDALREGVETTEMPGQHASARERTSFAELTGNGAVYRSADRQRCGRAGRLS